MIPFSEGKAEREIIYIVRGSHHDRVRKVVIAKRDWYLFGNGNTSVWKLLRVCGERLDRA